MRVVRGGAPTGAKLRPLPKHRESEAAGELHTAMHGGVWGLGKRPGDVLAKLDQIPPEALDGVRAIYRDRFDRDLDADAIDEAGKTHRDSVGAALNGERQTARAHELVERFGSGGALAALEMLRTEPQALASALEVATGRPLDVVLQQNLRGEWLEEARAAASGDVVTADVIAIGRALKGSDGGRVGEILARHAGTAKATNTAPIEQAFEARHGKHLRAEVFRRLDTNDCVRSLGVLDGSGPALKAVAVRDARSAVQLADALAADGAAEHYSTIYGEPAERLIRRRFTGRVRDILLAALPQGALPQDDAARAGLSEAARLHLELIDSKDPAAVHARFEGLPAEEAAAITDRYRETFGEDAITTAKRTLGSAAAAELEDVLRGAPTSLEDLVGRLRSRRERLRGGPANALSRLVMDHVVRTAHGKRADHQLTRTTRAAEGGDTARARRLATYAADDLGLYRGAKAKVANTAKTIVGGAATTATIISSGGTASLPALLHTASNATASRIIVGAALEGAEYDRKRVGEDVVQGLAGAAAACVGIEAGGAVARWMTLDLTALVNGSGPAAYSREEVGFLLEFIARASPGLDEAAMIGRGAAAGVAGSTASAAARTAVDGATWRDGVKAGLHKVGEAAKKAFVPGLLIGGGAGALMAFGSPPPLRVFTDAERAELTTTIDVRGTQIPVLGELDAGAKARLIAALEKTHDATGGAALANLDTVYILPLEPLNSGMATHNTLAMDPTMNSGTVIHELGHVEDLAHGRISDILPGFGEAPFVSGYAEHGGKFEDFADTFRVMIERWSSLDPSSKASSIRDALYSAR